MGEQLVLRGTMRAHTDMVTAIATPIDNSDMIVTASRDKSIILWNLTKEDRVFGVPRRRLTGHSHFVQDVVLSSDGQFALSGSWDGELRLWDLADGTTARRFVGHTKDVLSVAFSIDNRQIVSASRDKSIKLWNTLGECKYTIQDNDAHTDWVSCVRFSPNTLQPTIVSASWDKTVKIWNLTNCKLRATLAGHGGYVNTIAVSPDGSLCASGGKDGVILLWDLAEGKRLYNLDSGSIIHALCYSPNRYWLCAATESAIKIWDLESKTIVEELKVDLKAEADHAEGAAAVNKKKVIYCTSLSWSIDGSTLFSGFTDGVIRVYVPSRSRLDFEDRMRKYKYFLQQDRMRTEATTFKLPGGGRSNELDAGADSSGQQQQRVTLIQPTALTPRRTPALEGSRGSHEVIGGASAACHKVNCPKEERRKRDRSNQDDDQKKTKKRTHSERTIVSSESSPVRQSTATLAIDVQVAASPLPALAVEGGHGDFIFSDARQRVKDISHLLVQANALMNGVEGAVDALGGANEELKERIAKLESDVNDISGKAATYLDSYNQECELTTKLKERIAILKSKKVKQESAHREEYKRLQEERDRACKKVANLRKQVSTLKDTAATNKQKMKEEVASAKEEAAAANASLNEECDKYARFVMTNTFNELEVKFDEAVRDAEIRAKIQEILNSYFEPVGEGEDGGKDGGDTEAVAQQVDEGEREGRDDTINP